MSPIWLGVVLIIIFVYFRINEKRRKIYEFAKKVPGPRSWPILGSSLEFTADSYGIFNTMMKFSRIYDRWYQVWNNGVIYVIIKDQDDTETMMTDNVNITKSDSYNPVIPWIGYGLLLATGQKWKMHRRLITPTFFFKILDDFLEIFNKNSDIMVQLMSKEVGKGYFNMFNYVNRGALDNICETAMGVHFNTQQNEDSLYLSHVKNICRIACMRQYKVWLMPDPLFKLTSYWREQKKSIDFIHDSTRNIIKEKRAALKEKASHTQTAEEEEAYGKKKKAFLDLLLDTAGNQLTDEDLLDEVNTFMFEGHDTISSATAFALYEIGRNPDVQEKLYAEQMEFLGSATEPLTSKVIPEMRYMDKVVKETLRLYPSVPLYGRLLDEDLVMKDGTVVPKGVNIVFNLFELHRDPRNWKSPTKFDPENFESLEARHPYCYVPFSAGPRNCIGQKFAQFEMKATISSVVRNYKLISSDRPEHQLKISQEIVLISKTGWTMRVEKR